MILVRDVLEIAPEGMKAAREAVKESRAFMQKMDYAPSRIMTDMIGTYYTLVIESEFPDLGTFEKGMAEIFANAEWQKFYGRLRPMVRGGRREVFTIL